MPLLLISVARHWSHNQAHSADQEVTHFINLPLLQPTYLYAGLLQTASAHPNSYPEPVERPTSRSFLKLQKEISDTFPPSVPHLGNPHSGRSLLRSVDSYLWTCAADVCRTSRNVSLNGSTLRAECQRRDGSWGSWSEINTNNFLGNIDGNFQWGDANWTLTARNTHFNSPIVTSDLQRRDQSWVSGRTVNLDEHIANIDGQLIYQG
ncbi:Cyanovirin [Ceratobasidium theobromae]|uniref:Cyanovirin n=1 Tax=Ceratobasidium theobromae TaxID=1582974 RepID=A0A5N5QCZ8_9AGAM|nr:Cyanovirin [Ceratobasidium theobromae]